MRAERGRELQSCKAQQKQREKLRGMHSLLEGKIGRYGVPAPDFSIMGKHTHIHTHECTNHF